MGHQTQMSRNNQYYQIQLHFFLFEYTKIQRNDVNLGRSPKVIQRWD